MRNLIYFAIFASSALAIAGEGGDYLVSPAGASYRVVNTEAVRGGAPYTITPADAGDHLPAVFVRVDLEKPSTFGDLVNAVLKGTGISASYVGIMQLPNKMVAETKVSGDLKAVLETLAQLGGVSYVFKDNILRFTWKRMYVLSFKESTDLTYLTGQVRRNGGSVTAAPKGRNEVVFSADYAAMRRIRSDVDGFYALRRDPTKHLSSRSILVPDMVVRASSGIKPVVMFRDGLATIRWRGEITELIRQLAAATGGMYAGAHGSSRAITVDLDIPGRPLATAVETIGMALGNQADLVVQGKKYSIVYR